MRVISRPQLFRILEIDWLIRSGTYPNAVDLARRFELTPRTVHRDLEFLRDQLFAPLQYDSRRRGYFYRDPDYVLPVGELSEDERLAVLFSLQWLKSLPASPLRDQINEVLGKLPVLFPEQGSTNSERLSEVLSIVTDSLRGDESNVQHRQRLLMRAIWDRRSVSMKYFSSYRLARTQRCVDPYHLRFADGAWYVIGHCHLAGELRTFALDRMEHLEIMESSFERPKDFSIEDYLRYAWRHEVGAKVHKVILRVDPFMVPWLATRRWHWTQEERRYPDGSVHLHFRVSGLNEMKRWILQSGAQVEVLAPLALRQMVVNEAKELLERYGEVDTREREGAQKDAMQPEQEGLWDEEGGFGIV